MKNQHLSEAELQDYVINKTIPKTEMVEHLSNCKACQSNVKAYQLLFSELEKVPNPVFDFNVSELVMAQLEKPVPQYSWSDKISWLLVLLGVAIIAISFAELQHLFSGYGAYLSVLAAVMFFLIQLGGLYRKYKKQIELLGL